MYLLYVDESGDLTHPDAQHVVLGGVAVHESDARRLTREIEAVIARHLDPHLRHLELHAQRIRKGSGEWRGIPASVRQALLDDLAGLLATFPAKQPFALFGIARRPGAVVHAEPLERTYEELAMRFNSWIGKNRANGIPQNGMFICDEAKYEKVVQPLVADWRAGSGTRAGQLTTIVEVPLFVDSAASRLLQLADFVAHAIFIAYERDQPALFMKLSTAFAQRPNGFLDGLVHLTPDFPICPCLPCTSRRDVGEQCELPVVEDQALVTRA